MVNVDKVVKEAYIMWETTPSKLHPRRYLEGFYPLTTETYPVFSKYPTFVVDYQVMKKLRSPNLAMTMLFSCCSCKREKNSEKKSRNI